jgi:hypothetical protein
MAIVLSRNDFLRGVGIPGRYWEVSDNVTDLRILEGIPAGRTFVGLYVLRDTNPGWSNYSNTVVRYARWESASEHHAGAELRPILNGTMSMWSIVHPVGDLYVVYT